MANSCEEYYNIFMKEIGRANTLHTPTSPHSHCFPRSTSILTYVCLKGIYYIFTDKGEFKNTNLCVRRFFMLVTLNTIPYRRYVRTMFTCTPR